MFNVFIPGEVLINDQLVHTYIGTTMHAAVYTCMQLDICSVTVDSHTTTAIAKLC